MMVGMATQLRFVTLDCANSTTMAEFWASVLGWEIEAADEWGAVVHSTEPTTPGLFLQPVPEPKSTKNRMHLDIWVDDYESELARVLRLGARATSHGTTPDGRRFSILADPEGNEFCLVATAA